MDTDRTGATVRPGKTFSCSSVVKFVKIVLFRSRIRAYHTHLVGNGARGRSDDPFRVSFLHPFISQAACGSLHRVMGRRPGAHGIDCASLRVHIVFFILQDIF